MSASKSDSKSPGGLVRNHGFSAAGAAVFVLGRAADPALQYALFTKGYAVRALTHVGLRVAPGLTALGPGLGGLGPVPTLLMGMFSTAALRHVYWALCTTEMVITPTLSGGVPLFNGALNVFNTLVATYALSNADLGYKARLATRSGTLRGFADALGWKQWAGLALFTAGIAIEVISEETRKAFKRNPANKGKIDDTGLFGVVRHPNYLGYTLWRVGITLATGSLAASAAMLGVQVAMFAQSIPRLTNHMRARYGARWGAYEGRVRWAMLPGVW